MSCQSCKAFFRGFGLKNKIFRCPTNGKCILHTNDVKRKLCKRCRLDKCFAVGMRKVNMAELIRNNAEKERVKQLVDESKSKQSQSQEVMDRTVVCTQYVSDIVINDHSMGAQDIRSDGLREQKSGHEIITNPTSNTLVIRQNAIQKCPQIPLFRELCDYNGLTQLECNRISELMGASNILNYRLNKNGFSYKINDFEEYMTDFSHFKELFIRDIISFTKRLTSFGNICADDQLMLIKYSSSDLISILSLKYYNPETKSFITPLGGRKVNDQAMQLNSNVVDSFCYENLLQDFYHRFLMEWNYSDPLTTRTTTISTIEIRVRIGVTIKWDCNCTTNTTPTVKHARNFGAITCDSCKSFFRRTAFKSQLICASNGKCDINVMTRGLCRKCRLKKCLTVGMKSELIQSNGQNKCKKILIKEKVYNSKHKPSDESNNCDDFSPNNSQNNSLISDTTIDENSFLNSFNNICADDKYALMKYGGKDLVLIRFLKHYDRESHTLITPIDRDHSVQFDLDSNNNCIYIYCKDIYY
ncbi:unnamed protein product [Medioppia subpectinata]|uniref:Nuclear receptor domain-containing protein n=1 Tax=Medioppia subpectinata TaxID=1979941 RepID=A0A7R9KI06_9ACAR|nr:unnamed protein product [Medioppia subpectinata]CAG2104055.1 unnamed protein product [Medioppia subpectinata]